MQPDPIIREMVAKWLRHARADLALARGAAHDEETISLLCFHAQQATEKALKAILIAHDIDFPKLHIIERLIGLLPADLPLPSWLPETSSLTVYATIMRYPFFGAPISEAALQTAAALAEETVQWASQHIDEYFAKPTPPYIPHSL
jgi:HEPN domain-containing protein